MSASVFYQAFVPQGYDCVACFERMGEIVVELEPQRGTLQCGQCGSLKVHVHDRRFRKWKDAPYGVIPVWIVMNVPRVECQRCLDKHKTTHQVRFAEGLRRHTKHFESYVDKWLNRVTIQDVVEITGLSWDTIAQIDYRRLKSLSRPGLKQVRRIALDEVYVGKKHKFLTIVLDLDSRAIISVVKGRGERGLKPCFQRLKRADAQIKAVALDMSGSYYAAVLKHLPNAKPVFDHFHIIKLMNDKLTKLRRDLYHELTDKLHRDVLKGTRHLLLKNPQNLQVRGKGKQKIDEKAVLNEALKMNEPLNQAYYLKEDLRQLWTQGSRAAAEQFLVSWCQRAESTGITVLKTMANTLRSYQTAVLNWYDEPISTGPLEGTNNKIGWLQRRAYGYRNYAHFRERLLTLHHTRSKLVG